MSFPRPEGGTMDSKETASALPERTKTDTSLREERDKTDQQLATRSSVIEKDADQVIDLARERADDLLEDARHKEDAAIRLADAPVVATSTDLLMTLPVEGPAGERTQTEARRIRRITGQMNRLIGDLLDVVSMELGRVHVNATREDATQLLAETMENFRVTAASRK